MDGEFGEQAVLGRRASPGGIEEAEGALLQAKDGDVREVAPTKRYRVRGRLMVWAARHVEAATTSLSGMPSAIILDIAFERSFMPLFMLPT
ncbi:MAG: hypothetical protein U5J83_19465 [Bryobacterales bacterium]|nr:hypothetical protein [Bryobacterales bacterium]